jgi:uncharacterized protein (AIM24 family)
MKAIFAWLLNRALLYVLLVVAIGLAMLAWPSVADISRSMSEETASRAELVEQIEILRDEAQEQLQNAETAARTLPLDGLRARITQREEDRAAAQMVFDESASGWLAPHLPSQVLARKRAEIEIALIDRDLALMKAALAPRAAFAEAEIFLAENPTRPTAQSVAAAERECTQATKILNDFESRWEIDQRVRETLRSEQTTLERRKNMNCGGAAKLKTRRAIHLQAETKRIEARAALAALSPVRLPESYADDVTGTTLSDILLKALFALLVIIASPFVIRVVCWFALAPLAEKWPPMRFSKSEDPLDPAHSNPSGVSLAITLGDKDEVLVRQDFLQSSSMAGEKQTQWLLDWSHPLTSLASGMRFLTRIRGTGEQVVVSANKDVLAEVALLELPAGSAAVIRPSALAAIVQTQGNPVQIGSQWRLLSLPAWLTLQLRYFVFYGPAKLVLKGGRGVRIEPAAHGRIVGPGQLIGFTTALAYSVIRTETFWPYFFGRESLLKDRVEQGRGVLLIEQSPLAGKSGLRRGFEGAIDALLKIGGV